MQVKVLSKKLVKPSIATSDNLRHYRISCTDEVNPSMNVVTILYYQFTNNINIIEVLENSLSQVLPRFYPLAGRYIKEKQLVDCSDQGAEFVEAQVEDYELHQVMVNGSKGLKVEKLNDLVPYEIGAADEVCDPILAIQVTKFRCGGLAIGVLISHRIVDASGMGTFLAAWTEEAKLMHGGDEECRQFLRTVHPDFNSPLYFPGENLQPILDFGLARTRDGSIVSKRLVFDARAVTSLRDRVSQQNNILDASPGTNGHTNPHNRPPSRVVLVSSFLVEAFMRVDRRRHDERARSCLVVQAINIRERTVPPVFSKHSCGNLVALGIIELTPQETMEMKFGKLVPILRETSRKGVAKCSKILDNHKVLNDEFIAASKRCDDDAVNDLWFTDWSKFGFYDVDFGWGKPIWVSLVNVPVSNLIILMNTKNNNGLEAWVSLNKEDMAYFEEDEQVKQLTNQACAN